MNKKRKANARGMLPDGHIQLKDSYFKAEHAIYANPRYLKLSKVQRSLFWDLCATHNGKNNGDLALTPTFAEEFGWNYKTIKNNKSALVKSGLIRIVGQKSLSACSYMDLYALAWKPIDENCNRHITEEAKKKKVLNLKFDKG